MRCTGPPTRASTLRTATDYASSADCCQDGTLLRKWDQKAVRLRETRLTQWPGRFRTSSSAPLRTRHPECASHGFHPRSPGLARLLSTALAIQQRASLCHRVSEIGSDSTWRTRELQNDPSVESDA